MMTKLKYIVLFLLFAPSLFAAHIVGGEVTYKCIDYSDPTKFKVLITVKIYRDNKALNAAEFDANANFGVYLGSGDHWTFQYEANELLKKDTEVDIVNPNPCLAVPDDIGVDEGIYRFDLVLEKSNKSYLIAYQRCCRNESVSNIVNPGETGAAFTVEITPESQKSCNSSPVFVDFPPIVICADDDLYFDHSATDIDGDSIAYRFCNPLTAGGTRGSTSGDGTSNNDAHACDGVKPSSINCLPPFDLVQFAGSQGYSYSVPIPGNPAISIDSHTGVISGNPSIQGQYVVGVCAEEWRNGVLIGEIRRDFQFNVAKCDPLVFAEVKADVEVGFQSFEILSCGDRNLLIENESYLESNIFEYLWMFNINGDTISDNKRDLNIEFPDTGFYNGLMILNPNTVCADTALISVGVFPSIEADFSFDYDTCLASPVVFTDLSVSGSGLITSREWFLDKEDTLGNTNPIFQFENPGDKQVTLLVVDKNNCKDEISKTIRYYPVPEIFIVQPSSFIGCVPTSVKFNNLTEPIDTDYILNWDFGDGETNEGHEISPSHTYTTPGKYAVDLQIISPIGCEVSESYSGLITILDKPIADFSFTPEEPSVFRNTVSFTNLSQGEIDYNWNFGLAGNSLVENPIIQFQDTGLYKVRLIVRNDENCTDTATAELYLLAPVLLQFPNAFTPNNDALNDIFVPKGFFAVIKEYELNIFNRWGERIFNTNDPSYGWNGQKNNSGSQSPIGVYIFQAKFLDEHGKLQKIEGHVNLIR